MLFSFPACRLKLSVHCQRNAGDSLQRHLEHLPAGEDLRDSKLSAQLLLLSQVLNLFRWVCKFDSWGEFLATWVTLWTWSFVGWCIWRSWNSLKTCCTLIFEWKASRLPSNSVNSCPDSLLELRFGLHPVGFLTVAINLAFYLCLFVLRVYWTDFPKFNLSSSSLLKLLYTMAKNITTWKSCLVW